MLHREFEATQKTRRPLSARLIDVDRFKLYNDRCCLVADTCLKSVAGDVAVRFGGEEFAVLLPEGSEYGVVTAGLGATVRTANSDVGSAVVLQEKADFAFYQATDRSPIGLGFKSS